MYCTNCGNEIHNEAVICVSCGNETGIAIKPDINVSELEDDIGSQMIWRVLGFLIPILALTHYKKLIVTKPKSAWHLRFGAILSVSLITMSCTIFFVILYFVM